MNLKSEIQTASHRKDYFVKDTYKVCCTLYSPIVWRNLARNMDTPKFKPFEKYRIKDNKTKATIGNHFSIQTIKSRCFIPSLSCSFPFLLQFRGIEQGMPTFSLVWFLLQIKVFLVLSVSFLRSWDEAGLFLSPKTF